MLFLSRGHPRWPLKLKWYENNVVLLDVGRASIKEEDGPSAEREALCTLALSRCLTITNEAIANQTESRIS